MKRSLKLGVIVALDECPESSIKKVRSFKLTTCQISCWNKKLFTSKHAKLLKKAAEKYNVEITTIWAGWPGPAVWNLTEGPLTLGLVPQAYRSERIEALKMASDFAKMVGCQTITTHVGFIPENPNDPIYKELLVSLADLVDHCKKNGICFCFETGQETPVTLLRTIEDLGSDNLGINFDPANLLMYGKANPLDALDILGRYVRGVHAKDGEYPTDGRSLGKEKPLGEGRVNYPLFISKLKNYGYKGALTIEREISGPQQIKDIKKAIKFLTPLL